VRLGYLGGEHGSKIRDVAHLVALLYLNVFLWEYRDVQSKIDELLIHIEHLLTVQHIDCLESCELFIWTLLTIAHGSRCERRERVLRVTRMGYILRMLTEDDFQTVAEMLKQCLRGDGLTVDVPAWNAKNVRWDSVRIGSCIVHKLL
jgi:hypothetical protein